MTDTCNIELLETVFMVIIGIICMVVYDRAQDED